MKEGYEKKEYSKGLFDTIYFRDIVYENKIPFEIYRHETPNAVYYLNWYITYLKYYINVLISTNVVDFSDEMIIIAYDEVSKLMANPHYNQIYTREQIEAVLAKIKECVDNGRFQISMNENRQENIDFINEYNIYPKKRKEILMQISVEDFCHTLQNTKIGYEYEVLYVFVPQVDLFNALGEQERVDIYTKFNVIERADGNRTVVISFHKRNKPIDYLFR